MIYKKIEIAGFCYFRSSFHILSIHFININIRAINSNWIIAFQSLIEEKCIGK